MGATQHNRQWQAKVQGITADGGATLPDIAGVAFAKATDGSYPIVDATALGSPQCLAERAGRRGPERSDHHLLRAATPVVSRRVASSPTSVPRA